MLRRIVLVALLFGAMVVGLQRPTPVDALSCDPCPAYVTTLLNLGHRCRSSVVREMASISSSTCNTRDGPREPISRSSIRM
jgi:hypothetical protein